MGFKGKPKKGKGGGRIQITNIEELQLRNEHFDTQQRERKARRGDSDEDDSDEDDNGEKGKNKEDNDDVSSHLEKLNVKEGEKTTGEGDDTVFNFKKSSGLLDSVKKNNNANKQQKPEKMLNAKERAALGGSEGGPAPDTLGGLTRKQREAIEAARRKEAYMQKTLAGETEEGRRNLEKLAAVRKRREEAAAKKAVAEGRSKPGDTVEGTAAASVEDSKAVAKKKAAAASTDDDDDSIPKLKSIEIKKMNPAALKEALKARDLSIQGQKKELMARLTEYEAAR